MPDTEIQYMREAARQTAIGIGAAINEAREGRTESREWYSTCLRL
ncbi:MAG: hypothetical protein Q8P50_16810 [Bacillota bacterium]|nr:hypothetical protein [Bacillota bacterium]